MSQFFGCILSEKSSYAIDEVAEKMQSSMAFFTGATSLVYKTKRIFICNKLLPNSVESLNTAPTYAQTDRYILAASCRIDNRVELHEKLNFTGIVFGKSARSDHEYILEAYVKYQEECVDHLIGDFSFVIWDKQAQKLFMAKDHLGVKSLFYTVQNENIFFATDLNAFLNNPAIETLDSMSYLASMLHGSYLQTSAGLQHTCYETIFRLRPARCTVWTENKLVERKYWELKPKSTLKLEDEKEYYSLFYEKFKEAVKCRLRTADNIGLELSGGLDSSSIACVAGEIIKNEQKDSAILHTYSLVQSEEGLVHHPDFFDEEFYQDLIIERVNIKPENVVKLSKNPFKTFWEDLAYGKKIHGGFSKMNLTWQKPIYAAMQERNCSIKLSGFGGDEMVTNSGNNWIYEGIMNGDLSLLSRFDFKTYKALLRYGRYLLFGYKNTNKAVQAKELDSDYLNPYRTDLLLKKEHQISRKSYSHFMITNMTKPFISLRFESENLYALAHRGECRYPMVDIRLLEFLLSIPYQLFEPKIINRSFFRKALEGLLPGELLKRKDKNSAVLPYFRYKNWQYAQQIEEYSTEAEAHDGNSIINYEKQRQKILSISSLKRETDMASLSMTIFLDKYLLTRYSRG